ncbi:hypothetical protein [Parvibaculum sp.]|uniref:hypothetical protein n=1 Tax=Parvibaculum sp. TaxID=2024848 RepID=UPI0034A0AD73
MSGKPAERLAHGLAAAAPYGPSRDGGRGEEDFQMRGILLWAIGVPIPVIILIYLLF